MHRNSTCEDGQWGDEDRVGQSQQNTDTCSPNGDGAIESELLSIVHRWPEQSADAIPNNRCRQSVNISVGGRYDGGQDRNQEQCGNKDRQDPEGEKRGNEIWILRIGEQDSTIGPDEVGSNHVGNEPQDKHQHADFGKV